MMTLRRSLLTILGAATVAGCGGGGGGPGPGPTPVFTKTAGDNQVGPAGTPLGVLEVTVKDGSGNLLSGITVSWSAATGGGSVSPASFTTGADGKATATRTLGPGAGTQTTTASASGATPATFSHVAQIQGATQITFSGTASRSDSVKSKAPFSVLVRDQNNTPVAGVTVTWSSTGGGGTLKELVTTTNASGIASDTLTLTENAIPHTVQAVVTGLIGSPVTFTDDAVAGNAVLMALNGGNSQVGPVSTALPAPHTVIVRDAYDNPKSNAPVAWVVGLGGGSLNPAAGVTTNALGIASITRTLGASAGVHTDTASVGGLTGSPVVFTDTAGAVANVQVQNNLFNPTPAAVAAGTFVRFTWAGGNQHNVVWDAAPGTLPVDSPTQGSGTYTVRLTVVGAYAYHCTIHGSPGNGMNGVINVN
jgi:plastocyanin